MLYPPAWKPRALRFASLARILLPVVLCACPATAPAASGSGRAASPLLTAQADPRVRVELDYLRGRGRESMRRWLDRGGVFLPMIRRRLAEARLPEDLCWLPLIESGFSNTAVSEKGAAGMWQLMPETARMYGLRVDGLVDERRNPLKSTRAALRHLSDLMDRFDSPFLAAAAYNAGSARVERGLDRLREEDFDGRPSAATSFSRAFGRGSAGAEAFFRLSEAWLLARETRDYVPRLIAASMIGSHPEAYGFHPAPRRMPAVDSVFVTRAARLDQIALAAGCPPRAVEELNPEFIRGVTPPGARVLVLLPRGISAEARERIAALPEAEIPLSAFLDPTGAGYGARGASARWSCGSSSCSLPGSFSRSSLAPSRRWRVRHGGLAGTDLVEANPGESLRDLARRCGVSAEELARVNRLPRDGRLAPGQAVRVP